MSVKLLVLCCLVASCAAWLAPERCVQNKALQAVSTPVELKRSTIDIAQIAAKQHEDLLETYKDRKFVSVPIEAAVVQISPEIIIIVEAPFNCSFITHEPRLLSSVVCNNVNCKLSHTVTTVDSYTASEGYSWGVKIASKASFFGLFEAGGEASSGGTYSCTYNKGRTTSDLVECSDSTSGTGNLQLFNVQSDMICDFGRITLEPDVRNGSFIYFHMGKFTNDELEEIFDCVLVQAMDLIMIDMDKISDRLLNKIMKLVPLYNPYTDFIFAAPVIFQVYCFKQTNSVTSYRRVIPFTKENGDSVYQYACTKKPF